MILEGARAKKRKSKVNLGAKKRSSKGMFGLASAVSRANKWPSTPTDAQIVALQLGLLPWYTATTSPQFTFQHWTSRFVCTGQFAHCLLRTNIISHCCCLSLKSKCNAAQAASLHCLDPTTCINYECTAMRRTLAGHGSTVDFCRGGGTPSFV